MEIRKTEKSDIKRMMEIYEYAKEYITQIYANSKWKNHNMVHALLKYINQSSNADIIDEFLSIQHELDRRRGESLEIALPELAKLIKHNS